jgi:hypothetical protein
MIALSTKSDAGFMKNLQLFYIEGTDVCNRSHLAGFSGASLLWAHARETYSDASQTCSQEGRLRISEF